VNVNCRKDIKTETRVTKDELFKDWERGVRVTCTLSITQILIESTSGLSLIEDDSIDVRMAITAFGRTEFTKVKDKIGVEETFWG
jgi:hypothetical protein